jgi:pimeloyl-ACP methyl ester carboxylesterase
MEVLAAFASVEGLNSSERIRQYLKMAFSAGFAAENAETVDRFCRLREDNAVPREVYLQQLHSAMTFNTEERLAAIAAPTLVITGDADTVVPTQNSLNLAAKIANARLEMMAGTGHMAFVEKAEHFNLLIRNFLRAIG